MNKDLTEALAKAANAFKQQPVEFCYKLSVKGFHADHAIWLWIKEIVPCPPEFMSFLSLIAEGGPETIVSEDAWVNMAHDYMLDINTRIYPGLGLVNEWGIPLEEMQLMPSMFTSREFRQKNDESTKQKVYRTLCKKSNYPNAWIKQGEIVKILQGSFNAEQIRMALEELYNGGHIMAQVTEGRGRPATAYAAIAGRKIACLLLLVLFSGSAQAQNYYDPRPNNDYRMPKQEELSEPEPSIGIIPSYPAPEPMPQPDYRTPAQVLTECAYQHDCRGSFEKKQ